MVAYVKVNERGMTAAQLQKSYPDAKTQTGQGPAERLLEAQLQVHRLSLTA